MQSTASHPAWAKERSEPKVAILMGTYNGERFLREQLNSIERQTHAHWDIYVSDDGSTDGTVDIVREAQQRRPTNAVVLRSGPQRGFVANFLSLACDPSIKADYFAFCDQDDVWDESKLSTAVRQLNDIPASTPALYCTRTRLIDEFGGQIGFSPLFQRKPSFRNALVQSIAGANTMVFNNAARQLLINAGIAESVISHDWWTYMLVTGNDGHVIYDSTPSTNYRQHTKNLVGSNIGWHANLTRAQAVLRGHFTHWNKLHIAALSAKKSAINDESQRILHNFVELRSLPALKRFIALANSGLYRQTTAGSVSLYIAALLGKI